MSLAKPSRENSPRWRRNEDNRIRDLDAARLAELKERGLVDAHGHVLVETDAERGMRLEEEAVAAFRETQNRFGGRARVKPGALPQGEGKRIKVGPAAGPTAAALDADYAAFVAGEESKLAAEKSTQTEEAELRAHLDAVHRELSSDDGDN